MVENPIEYVEYQGKMVPLHFLDKSRNAQLRAYLAGYGNEIGSSVPEEFSRDKKLTNSYLYGCAVGIEGKQKLYTRDGIHFRSRKIRQLETFNSLSIGSDESQDREPGEMELTFNHMGDRRPLGFTPFWAWPGQVEDVSRYERRVS